MSTEPKIGVYRAVAAGAFLSGLVGLELLLTFFCAGFPLIIYLVVGALGAWFGGAFRDRLAADSGGARFLRVMGRVLALFTMFGIIALFALPLNWDTKCSWRYCGRTMGPGLLVSPFLSSTPSCSAWHTCANEYPFKPGEYRRMLRRMDRQGCAPP